MQAIQGVYDNGILKLDKKASLFKSRVIVLFIGNEARKKMPTDEAMRIFLKYAGSVKGNVDLEKEGCHHDGNGFGYSHHNNSFMESIMS